ncbi:MmgE/PrpD family protein [Xanthobacter sediminis]
MDTITRKAADFVAGFDPASISAAAREAVRIGMLDCVGVMLAGAREPAVKLVSTIVTPSARNDAAPAVNGSAYDAPDAALVNGVAGHILDFDDVALAGHPSVVLTPAILAEGATLGSSGEEAVAAYLAGYELWAHLGQLEPGHMHERGFHPTAVMGTLATAAAAARLHRLDAEQTLNALAIAASLAAGLVANFGSLTKSLHAGRTAQSGILAARLAKAGYAGSPDALEHKTGFLKAFSPSGTPNLDPDAFHIGERWLAEEFGVNIKRYPICYATHRAIDAMLDLAELHDLKPEDIAGIEVETGMTQKLMLRNSRPQTGLEAKFSMEFAMASAVVARSVGLKELTDDFVSRPDVQELQTKVEVKATEDSGDTDLPFAPFDLVTVELKDGRRIAHDPVAYAKGSWEKRLSKDELHAKFMDCAGIALDAGKAERLFEQLYAIETLADLRELSLA